MNISAKGYAIVAAVVVLVAAAAGSAAWLIASNGKGARQAAAGTQAAASTANPSAPGAGNAASATGSGSSGSSGSSSASSGSSGSSGTGSGSSGSGPAPMLPAGRVGARSDVPWARVGPGWMLAEYTRNELFAPPSKPTTLYLVDPLGGRYVMWRWAAGHTGWNLDGWSGDHTRALLQSSPAGGHAVLHELTLASGAMTSFTLPATTPYPDRSIGYSRPHGTRVIAFTTPADPSGMARLERFSRTGTPLATLITEPASNGAEWVMSPDGTVLAISKPDGIEFISNSGGSLGHVSIPGVDTSAGCSPSRWWNSGTVLALCHQAGGARQMWLIPDGGGSPTRLGAADAVASEANVWRLPSGLYFQSSGPGCATAFIARQVPGGTATEVNVPGSPYLNQILAVYGSRLLVASGGGCSSHSESLIWFNPASHTVQTLIPPPATGRGVIAVIPAAS